MGDAAGEVQVADEGAHEARLADAGRKGEAEGGKVPFEVGDGWELALYCGKRCREITALLRRHNLCDAIENLQRCTLRRAQAQASGDGIDVAIHLSRTRLRNSVL